MKYKGFLITPVYLVGSDFMEKSNGTFVTRNPTSKDIEYYEIYDSYNLEERFGAEFSIKECKNWIDEIHKKIKEKI